MPCRRILVFCPGGLKGFGDCCRITYQMYHQWVSARPNKKRWFKKKHFVIKGITPKVLKPWKHLCLRRSRGVLKRLRNRERSFWSHLIILLVHQSVVHEWFLSFLGTPNHIRGWPKKTRGDVSLAEPAIFLIDLSWWDIPHYIRLNSIVGACWCVRAWEQSDR